LFLLILPGPKSRGVLKKKLFFQVCDLGVIETAQGLGAFLWKKEPSHEKVGSRRGVREANFIEFLSGLTGNGKRKDWWDS